MYSNPHLDALEAGDDYVGLGFWSALVPIGVSVIGGIGGDDGSIDKREYYNGSKSRIWCPERSPAGATPELVTQGIAELGFTDPLRAKLNKLLGGDKTWDELGITRPRGSSEKAHVTINNGNGWRYCPRGEGIGGTNLENRELVEAIVAVEIERRRTLEARARAVAGQAQEFVTAEIIPGVSTPLLAIGAVGLAAAFILRRR